MSRLVKILAALVCIGLSVCRSDQRDATNAVQEQARSVTSTNTWKPYLYAVRAGGPNCFVSMTNAPESNHVRLFFKKWGGVDPESKKVGIFGFTNQEPREILLYNVRVQVPSEGKGTDGFGWDTVYDDYPSGTPDCNTGTFPPGKSGEISASRAGERWRVCILYSIRDEESTRDPAKKKFYCGNYEVIGPEMK